MMTKGTDKDRPYLALTLGTLVIGGGVIIGLVYGVTALLTALPFLLFGALMITILWFVVSAVSGWREKSERADHDAAARHIAQLEPKKEEASGTDDSGR